MYEVIQALNARQHPHPQSQAAALGLLGVSERKLLRRKG